MGIRQPGMQREERELDGKGQEEGGEQPELGIGGELGLQQFMQPEGGHTALLGVQQVQGDDRQQHQQRTEHGEEEELDRRVDACGHAPRPRSGRTSGSA